MRISDWSSDVCSSDLPRQSGFQFVQPDPRGAVRGCTPVASGRERATAGNFRPVRDGRPFELTNLEETEQEVFQPVPYGRKIIAVPGALRTIDRPCPSYRIAPWVPGQESAIGRRQAIATDRMQTKNDAFVRAHLSFRALKRPACISW